jgi:hypothetical protein
VVGDAVGFPRRLVVPCHVHITCMTHACHMLLREFLMLVYYLQSQCTWLCRVAGAPHAWLHRT